MAENTSSTNKLMKNVVMKLKPHAQYLSIMHQLADNKFDATTINKFDVISTYLCQETTRLSPPEEHEPGIFLLYIEQMGGCDFVSIGLNSTGKRMSGAPLETIQIIEINNHAANESYLEGSSNLTTHFMNTHRLS